MRHRGWSPLALAMVFPVMLFAVSCSRKVVQTHSQPVSMTDPEARKSPAKPMPEVQKSPVRPATEVRKDPAGPAAVAEPDGRRDEARLRAEAAARLAALTAFVGENVHFAFGSSLLSDQARQILNGKAGYLRSNPDITVTVEGHCDDRGTNAYNVALGERRARSVKMFLVDLGIGTDRLNTASYGEERPVAPGHDEASWAANRRAQFVIDRSADDRRSVKN
ncbi:MAG: OmpA family protein [Deltaproteobacteria bacterium]